MNKKLTIHNLKIQSEYYDDVITGVKRFELRKDDRGFEVGDLIVFLEYKKDVFTGRVSEAMPILYKLKDCPEYGLKDGYCILGL